MRNHYLSVSAKRIRNRIVRLHWNARKFSTSNGALNDSSTSRFGRPLLDTRCHSISSINKKKHSTWLGVGPYYSSSFKVGGGARRSSSSDLVGGYEVWKKEFGDECNVPPNIAQRIGTNLHLQPNHPLHTIKQIIETHINNKNQSFHIVDNLNPIVSTQNNFDSLLIPPDHVSRSKSDTYYINSDTVLRTHTSAHQTTLLSPPNNFDRFLVTGDVYRRDEIDSSHYPVFHQMEGVKMFSEEELTEAGAVTRLDKEKVVELHLKELLESMAKELFGDVPMRWDNNAYFPFTDPSFELEIWYNDDWLEVLGCGVVHKDIVRQVGRGDQLGWAFGLGLERLAMVLFSIPDIRLFWTKDTRFHKQFQGQQQQQIIQFQPYSKYPPCLKDISFWTTTMENDNVSSFHPNDLYEVVRDVAGDLVEQVELIDEFIHPKTKRTSNCFRIHYRSMDRSLTNEEIDTLQEKVRWNVVHQLGMELR